MTVRNASLLAVLATGLLVGCQQGGPTSPRRAPELSITTARGIDPRTKMANFRGKWVLIDFWSHT